MTDPAHQSIGEDQPFFRMLATKYDPDRQDEAIEILDANPEIATMKWAGPDDQGKSFVKSATALDYAANNAHIEGVKLLLEHGARPDSINAVHAAAYGGSDCGSEEGPKYAETIKILIAAGADINDRRYHDNWTPLKTAIESGNQAAITYLRSIGAEN